MSYTENDTILIRNVEDEMKESYLRYSMSVIVSRALPDVRDGLKPSQRRILFAMRQLNLGPNGKHRKCAKISGDTSGDYHPHGDMVIYPTMVRMAQEWIMRYQLIDGQGNFGSVDGDPPAAMRYTEARLTASSTLAMEDLDKDTVDFIPNYDETKEEPVVFPAKFPNLLCNGSSGIAVGMATNIPPHNLHELAESVKLVLDNPLTTIDEIMKVMPAPDFPTGGIICGFRGIKEAFHTGRGRLVIRARTEVEDMPNSNDRQRIIIHELPYGVNKARMIQQIADLINNKTVMGISDLRDESDKDGMRIVIELKRNEVADVTLNQLYKFSDLQNSFGCNMLALDKGLPRLMNVKQMMCAWIDHRIEVIRRRTRFELNKAEARAHVLEGYLKAISSLDEVVQLVKKSANRDEARSRLIERFEFTERQANAVLDLRLYQLTGLEKDKIEDEYKALQEKISYFKEVLANESMVKDIIKDELAEVQKKNKSERRTSIVAAEGDFNMEDLIADEQVIIAISEDDYIKRMPIDTFKEQRRGGHGVVGMDKKREDDVIKDLYVVTTHDYLMIFTSLGRCYWLKAWQIPETGRRSKGRPLINLLEDFQEEEKIATVLRVPSFESPDSVVMVTKQGTVKKTALKEYSNPRKKGVWALKIDEGDALIGAHIVNEKQQIMLFTSGGMAVRFESSKIRNIGRLARGVRGVSLKEDQIVVGCEAVDGSESVLVICENGFGKRTSVEDFRQTNRGGLGVRSIVTSERNGSVVGALKVNNEDGVLMMSSSGQTVRTNMKDLRIMGRNTQGVKLVNLKKGDVLVAVQKIEAIEGVDEEAEDESLASVGEGKTEE